MQFPPPDILPSTQSPPHATWKQAIGAACSFVFPVNLGPNEDRAKGTKGHINCYGWGVLGPWALCISMGRLVVKLAVFLQNVG